VAEEYRPAVIGAAIGLAVAAIEAWPPSEEREAALRAVLAAAWEQLAGGPQGAPSAVTPSDAVTGLLAQARQALLPTVRVELPVRSAVVGDFQYDILAADAKAEGAGELTLTLRVRMTNNSPYDATFWSRSFRFQAGDEASAPRDLVNELVAGRTTKTAEVTFIVPSALRGGTLLVGDDSASAVPLAVAFRPIL
jgi:hypothetical protein